VTLWCVRFAEDLTVLPQQLMRLDQRIVAPGQRWCEYNLCVAVRLAIVPFIYAIIIWNASRVGGVGGLP